MTGLRIFHLFQRSLRFQIALIYGALSLCTVLFFILLVYENQSDILLSLFRLESEKIVRALVDQTERAETNLETTADIEELRKSLAMESIQDLKLVFPDASTIDASAAHLDAEKRKRIQELINTIKGRNELFAERFAMNLNEDTLMVDAAFPLPGHSERFLVARISAGTITERLSSLYAQIGIIALWVLVFHLGFAFYVFRVILRRIGILTHTSQAIGNGQLDQRIQHLRTDGDELDELGMTFNGMASNLESKVTAISRLNEHMLKELRIGKMVQELIVNNSAGLEMFRPFAFYRPLREVSGDVYKFYALRREGVAAVFFGDASGHGVSAALITSLVVNHLDRLLRENINPVFILNGLNESLFHSLSSSYYSTACFVMYHEKTGRLLVCNAGALPPMVVRPSSGQLVEFGASGPPAGIMPDAGYSVQAVKVRPGDKIILYSDGITEAVNGEKNCYGQDRLKEAIIKNAAGSTHELGEAVIADVSGYSTEFSDDATFIVLEVPACAAVG